MKINYFELFSLPSSFNIDLKKLDESYFLLQKKYHPDAFIDSSEEEKRKALQQASVVNDGYMVLKSPLKRSKHILLLNGYRVNFEGKDRVLPSQEVLLEFLDIREKLSKIFSLEELDSFLKTNKEYYNQILNLLSSSIEKSEFDQAMNYIIYVHYLEKLFEEIVVKEKSLSSKNY